jgi:hypothetical protein
VTPEERIGMWSAANRSLTAKQRQEFNLWYSELYAAADAVCQNRDTPAKRRLMDAICEVPHLEGRCHRAKAVRP